MAKAVAMAVVRAEVVRVVAVWVVAAREVAAWAVAAMAVAAMAEAERGAREVKVGAPAYRCNGCSRSNHQQTHSPSVR